MRGYSLAPSLLTVLLKQPGLGTAEAARALGARPGSVARALDQLRQRAMVQRLDLEWYVTAEGEASVQRRRARPSIAAQPATGAELAIRCATCSTELHVSGTPQQCQCGRQYHLRTYLEIT